MSETSAGTPGLDNAERLAANLLLEAELRRLEAWLSPVPFIVLKGTPLSCRLPGGLSGRRSGDIDLLVREGDLPEVLERLTAHNYELSKDLKSPLERLAADGQLVLWRRTERHVFELDLHRTPLAPDYFRLPKDLGFVTNPRSVLGRQFLLLSPEVELISLAAHAFQHHLEPGQLRLVASAHQALAAEIDSSQLRALARQTCGWFFLQTVLDLAAASHRDSSGALVPSLQVLGRSFASPWGGPADASLGMKLKVWVAYFWGRCLSRDWGAGPRLLRRLARMLFKLLRT